MKTSSWKAGDGAAEAYGALAAFYEAFTHDYQSERWTGRLLSKADEAGRRGTRLLDVGCGTGLSFLPLLDRGWTVTGCDISPQMLEIARSKTGNRAELLVGDMRELPALGQFDLVWSVNDAVNYLLSLEELQAAMLGMRQNLAPHGVLLFDVNAFCSYRTFFAEEVVVEKQGERMIWKGHAEPDFEPGDITYATFEVEGKPEATHVHRQRHFPEAEILAALEGAGLSCRNVYGELEGELSQPLDEEHHSKVVYVATVR